MTNSWPLSAVPVIAQKMLAIEGISQVMERPLRGDDATNTGSVFARDWQPIEYAIGQFDPALSVYHYTVQVMMKGLDQVQMRNELAVASKRLRLMLYRDTSLRVGLAALREDLDGMIERFQKLSVPIQRFHVGDIKGAYAFMSSIDLSIETETV